MTDDAIKPCCLCGETPTPETVADGAGVCWWVMECSCGCGSVRTSRRKAILGWNRRSGDMELAKESRDGKEACNRNV